MSKNLEFKVSSGLKDIIGKDLITDDFIAVFELVKNSYDARSKNVQIIIENDKIIISDNGKGMSFDDLVEKWLFVAYSAKRDNTEDSDDDKKESYRDKIQERRHYAGAKGIGRFSSDRLGKLLTIKTRNKESDKVHQVKVDWSLFEFDQKEIFEKIKVEYDSLTTTDIGFPRGSKYGTILEISELYTKWDRDRLKQLKHSLEKLINPFSETNDFNIEIICERELKEDNKLDKEGKPVYIERNRINGEVKNSILEILDIKTTQINIVLKEKRIETKIVDRGTPIYHIIEENKEYSLLKDIRIDLYFLNNAAKNNFTRKMGVQVVNFGSVFLFKNGFRVQPFGEVGDDSWKLDYRAQQGYNRFLGTRDLFGKVEILTDDSAQFKEVSSRDGGLVETFGYHQLMKAFKDKGLIRLERYVVGVLWGEGFKKRKYFGEGIDADQRAEEYREELRSKDKVADNTSTIEANLGSKLDFIQIIKSLSSNKEVEIVDYNKDFVNLVNEKIDDYQTRFVRDLETIAEHTNDQDLKNRIKDIEAEIERLRKEKIEAEKRARTEEEARKKAEEKAKAAEYARALAEKQKQEEEEKRVKAELAAEKKEKEKIKAELARIKAENKAKEEKEARKKAEKEVKKREEQAKWHRSSTSIEYKDLRDSNHIIGVYSDDISKKILSFKRKLDKGVSFTKKDILSFIQGVSLANEKISALSRFTTKSNYLQATLETKENIVEYISNYIRKTYLAVNDLDVEIINEGISFIREFQPIELSVVVDNILSNSKKKNAKKVIVEFNMKKTQLEIRIRDVGTSLSESIENPKLIFEEGITTTKGSGLGLSHVKRIIEDDFDGSVEYNTDYTDGFELIIKIGNEN